MDKENKEETMSTETTEQPAAAPAEKKKERKKKSLPRRILNWALVVIGSVIFLAAAFIGILTLREYKPEATESIELSGESSTKVLTDTPYNVLTYNIGYAALDAQSDFFMDGGDGVLGRSRADVRSNIENITATIANNSANIVFLQEVDVRSKRSYRINELEYITQQLGGVSAFAYNYKCDYVPYPWPTLGKISSGLLTVTSFSAVSAERIALSTPFSWPLSTCNLKRCLLVERIPVEGTDHELVLVNLHLEAYDDGEGKKAQTEMLAALLTDEYEKGNYVIAGGDFNQTFPQVDMSEDGMYYIKNTELWQPGTLDTELFGSGWQIVCDTAVPTCRLLNQPYDPTSEETQYYVIDGYIVSPNVSVNMISTRDTEFAYTDHNPVFMNITLIGE